MRGTWKAATWEATTDDIAQVESLQRRVRITVIIQLKFIIRLHQIQMCHFGVRMLNDHRLIDDRFRNRVPIMVAYVR